MKALPRGAALCAVPAFVCADTVRAFEQLLSAAKAGHIVGAVFGVQLQRKHYLVDSCGELARDPTLARGIVASIDDELRVKVQQQTDGGDD
jgi:hypothetical protein